MRALAPLAMFSLALLASRSAHAEETPTVRVHLEDRSTRLERDTPGGWQLACEGACAREIPAGRYRLLENKHGNLEEIGDPFQLDPEHTADVRVKPNRGRSVLIGLGVLGMVTGGLAGIGGWMVSSFTGFCRDPNDSPCPPREAPTEAVVVAVAGGIVFLAGTISLIAGVKQPGVVVSKRETSATLSWRIPEPSRIPAGSPAMTFPLLSGRF